MVSEDSAVLLKWMTDMRVLEFYEGRDKKYTEELIYEDFFEEDDEIALKVILEYDGKPIGYGQIYEMIDDYYGHYGYENRNETLYCIDQFIGEPDAVIMDPHQDNARAIRCYRKAGFRIIKSLPEHELHEGKMRDCYLMEYRYEDNA